MFGGDHFDSTPAGGAPSGNWFLGPLILVENVVGEKLRLNPRFYAPAHRAKRFHPVRDFLFAPPPLCRASCVTQLALLLDQHCEPTHVFGESRSIAEANDPFFILTAIERTLKNEMIVALQVVQYSGTPSGFGTSSMIECNKVIRCLKHCKMRG